MKKEQGSFSRKNIFTRKTTTKGNNDFYSKEEDSGSNSRDNEVSEAVFICIEEPNKKEDSKYEEESYVEAKVNMEA